MNRWFKVGILACVIMEAFLIGMVAHAYVFDCHFFSPREEYELTCKDPTLSFEDWLVEKEEREGRFFDWFVDGCAVSLDPTYASCYDTPDGHDKDNDHSGRD